MRDSEGTRLRAHPLAASLPACPLPCCSEANAEVLQGTVLELLRVMVEEADELPQAQLDVVLSRLLPAHRAESPAGHALTAALLQRTETTVRGPEGCSTIHALQMRM